MYHMERKRDEDRQRSEAVFHFKGEQDMSGEKQPDNYKPHWSERDEQTRPREMFSMSNSYGNVSVAANRKKEMTLAVSEKRRHNSETLDNDHKKLNGERRRAVVGPLGWAYTNSFNPINSAFALKTGKLQPAKRVLAQINKYVDINGQNTVESTLPFLNLERDKKRLHGLINEIVGARKENKDLLGLEREKERLSRDILQKEQMQSRFLKRLHLAIEKAKVVTDSRRTAWPKNVMVTDGISISDEPPGDEEDDDLVEGLIGGLNEGVQDKIQGDNT